MGRSRRNIFARTNVPGFVVVWDLHWQLIDSQPVLPSADPRSLFEAAIARLAADGWTAESAGEFGFTFVARRGERRLVALTARDPLRTGASSFSPFTD